MLEAGGSARGQGAMALKFFEIVVFSEILVFRQKMLGLLMLVKLKASSFIVKSLTLTTLLYRCHGASV